MVDSVLRKIEEESEIKNEPTFPAKRKLDPVAQEEEKDEPNKAQKLQPLTDNGNSPVTENQPNIKTKQNYSVQEEEDDEDADYDEDADDDEEEGSGEAAVVDRKGKGIMIEEDEDDSDDDDDSTDVGSELDADDGSELEDDPLAEVDLDNILPSRTRRGGSRCAGVYIANDLGNHADDDDDDGDHNDA